MSPPRKTLIFHIGDRKTGSTSIQLAFARQQVSLSGRSVFYPARLTNNELFKLCRAYADPEHPKAQAEACGELRKIAAKVRAAETDFCLLSAEGLEDTPADILDSVIAEFFADTADDIRLIAYVRPHAPRILSSYAERTKVGLRNVVAGNLEDFFDLAVSRHLFFYTPRFAALRKHFGNRFILRPMIPDQLYRNSVVDDLVRHAFDTEDFAILGDTRSNESLCLEDLMRLKVLQSHIGQTKKAQRLERPALGWEFTRLIGQMPPPDNPTKLRLHASLAARIKETYQDDARAMDQAFFDGQPLLESDLDRAIDTAIAAPQPMDPKDHFSASELRSLEVLSRTVASLFSNKTVDWQPFLRNRRVREVLAYRPPSDPASGT